MTKKSVTSDILLIEKVLQKALYLHLAFSQNDQPYIVPLSFGYQDGILYLHSKSSGRKLDILEANPHVAFALEDNVRLLAKDDPCGYSFVYACVSGSGRALIIEDQREKRQALDILARHYQARALTCPDEALTNITVFKVIIENMSLKTAHE